MLKPDLLIDYDEIDNICGDLDENQRELYESNSEINYDEKSSVACNANSQASCMDAYAIRMEVCNKIADVSDGLENLGVTFSDLELKLQGCPDTPYDSVREVDGTVIYNRDYLGYKEV